MNIAANLAAIQQRIALAAKAAGRNPDDVTLIAVTKSVGIAEVQALYDLGVRHFGENRPEDAAPKLAAIPPDAIWHAIGNLQRRKAKVAVEGFQRIDAVDRLELAEALQARCAELRVKRKILLEVNVSGEAAKHGFRPEEIGDALRQVSQLSALTVRGLMTMAPFGAPEAELRQVFSGLHRLAQQHRLQTLSMGMTDDFEIAIAEGATEVRIGRALFV